MTKLINSIQYVEKKGLTKPTHCIEIATKEYDEIH